MPKQPSNSIQFLIEEVRRLFIGSDTENDELEGAISSLVQDITIEAGNESIDLSLAQGEGLAETSPDQSDEMDYSGGEDNSDSELIDIGWNDQLFI